MHGTYETIDERDAVRFERRYPHPVEKVWRAVTDPAELKHWFPAEVTVDLRAGGAMRFVFPDGEMPPTEGEVTEFDPPRVFAFTWDQDRLRFELEPEGGGAACRLRFLHVIAEPDAAARNAAGWHVCLEMLSRHLAGEPAAAPGSAPTEDWRELYEEYIERGFPSGAPIPSQG
jgi:uncharacterized protein YndB with AHSA1/START domain